MKALRVAAEAGIVAADQVDADRAHGDLVRRQRRDPKTSTPAVTASKKWPIAPTRNSHSGPAGYVYREMYNLTPSKYSSNLIFISLNRKTEYINPSNI